MTKEEKITQLMQEKHDVTINFARAARAHRMSMRGLTILHVVAPGTSGAEVTPMIRAALRAKRTNGETPTIETANSIEEGLDKIELLGEDLRIVVIESDIERTGEGVMMAYHLQDVHKELPLLVATEDACDVGFIHKQMPFVDVFVSGSMSARDLMQVFGAIMGANPYIYEGMTEAG